MTTKKKTTGFSVGLDSTGAFNYTRWKPASTATDLTVITSDTITFTKMGSDANRLEVKDSTGTTVATIDLASGPGSWTPSTAGDHTVSDDSGKKLLGKIKVSSPNPEDEARRPASPGTGRQPRARRR